MPVWSSATPAARPARMPLALAVVRPCRTRMTVAMPVSLCEFRASSRLAHDLQPSHVCQVICPDVETYAAGNVLPARKRACSGRCRDRGARGNGMRPEFQDVVDEVPGLLGRPVTLEDRNVNLVAFAPPPSTARHHVIDAPFGDTHVSRTRAQEDPDPTPALDDRHGRCHRCRPVRGVRRGDR
ncbi:hypothetical protein AERO9AM_10545 [Aeromicrobium sp. 9AM]|nr:hypothetical protein AERO9AM_10545 [Aeromicrobium sp. 9AM]